MKPIRCHLAGLLEAIQDKRMDKALEITDNDQSIQYLHFGLDNETWEGFHIRSQYYAAAVGSDNLWLWRYWTRMYAFIIAEKVYRAMCDQFRVEY